MVLLILFLNSALVISALISAKKIPYKQIKEVTLFKVLQWFSKKSMVHLVQFMYQLFKFYPCNYFIYISLYNSSMFEVLIKINLCMT
jgi:hypothetical protein